MAHDGAIIIWLTLEVIRHVPREVQRSFAQTVPTVGFVYRGGTVSTSVVGIPFVFNDNVQQVARGRDCPWGSTYHVSQSQVFVSNTQRLSVCEV